MTSLKKYNQKLDDTDIIFDYVDEISKKNYLFSAMKITNNTNIEYDEVVKILNSSSRFKKSKLKSNGGYDVFYKNSFFSKLFNFIITFRHVCYLKYYITS